MESGDEGSSLERQGNPDRRAPVVHPDVDGVGPDGDADHRRVGTDDESEIAVEHALFLVTRPAADPEGAELLGDGVHRRAEVLHQALD
jgi:hypothetical protein